MADQGRMIKSLKQQREEMKNSQLLEHSSQRISSPIQALLNTYKYLDDDAKKNLMHTAMLSNNEMLQRELFKIQQSKPITGLSLQAKLAKELIKLAETYKISELVFETKATKRRSNYLTWWSKLRPILAMFPQNAVVFKDNEIIPFPNPNNIGNRALYLLIYSKVDEYFQWSIEQFEGFGDKALASIKIQCTNISA